MSAEFEDVPAETMQFLIQHNMDRAAIHSAKAHSSLLLTFFILMVTAAFFYVVETLPVAGSMLSFVALFAVGLVGAWAIALQDLRDHMDIATEAKQIAEHGFDLYIARFAELDALTE